MATGPNTPSVDHEALANPPLRAMLGQVQFPTIARLETLEGIAPLQDAIRESFPLLNEEIQVEVAFGPGEAGHDQPRRIDTRSHRFMTQDETWSAVLTTNSLTLEAAPGERYASYKSFRDHFESLWCSVLKELKPSQITRQGLRYVDHLEGERSPAEWCEWINPELLGPFAGDVLGSGLTSTLSVSTFQRDHGYLLFRHGITQAGPANAWGYLLDIDDVQDTPLSAESTQEILDRFDVSHDSAYQLFRWSVSDKAIEEFRNGA